MLRKINSIKIIAGLTATLAMTGCEKLIDIPAPVTEISSARVFTSDKLALSALSGAFSSTFGSQTLAVNLTSITSLVSDDMSFLANTNYDEFTKNTYAPGSSTSAVSNLNGIWIDLYAGIYRFNSNIEGAAESTALTDAVKQRVIAESKFMRAYCYFYLVNLYGEVPLILETDVSKTALAPKNSIAAINTQIITDLQEARDRLPADYSASPGFRTSVTRWAASALLARIYLYNKQWALAEQEASKVIDDAGALYAMTPAAALENTFLKASAEAIFQFGPYLSITSGYTYEGSTFVSNTSQYSLTEDLAGIFDVTDARRTKWIKDTTFSGVLNHQSYKYRLVSIAAATAAGKQEAPTALRLAEQYLIRAEARLNQQKLPEARADLNVVRVRANTAGSVATAENVLRLEIEDENRREFFNEYGHRWMDLRRTGRINTVLGAKKSTWQARAAYFPLPQAAVDANPNLIQNPDYN
ncbi:RagB/SusD family nutrient uptake outer membrane protein [Chitinophaga sp. CC14]|uniref:RagB/SusD family nutrient uptake outer membrane protein n=1 Tax=Chitinophaga sp. CC14 TaxID=3029199 RepID=UPI003B9861B2